MLHDAHGFWIAEAGSPEALPPLAGEHRADVVVVGGGYTGLWTAWHLLAAAPGADVVVLESGRCGHGPSGRNGGFVTGMDLALSALRGEFGDAAAEAWGVAARETVDAVGAWCEAEGVDAWYRKGGELVVSTAPAQDAAVGSDAIDGSSVLAQSAEQARARCDSPVFRSGVFMPAAATVHPARLAFGLRERLLARGARIYEGSRVTGMRPVPAGIAVRTAGGREVRARTGVLAVCAASGALPPVRNRLTVSSSHIVCTEPVPDVIEQLGWDGGERSRMRARCCTTRARRATGGSCSAGPAAGWRPARARTGAWTSTTV
jgi:glycine/D-amino acid oxidase-like deaminating enzyme